VTVVDIQISPANCDWPELRDASLAADQMGFGALWAFDHMAGVALGGHTMLECFTLLGALAELTSSIELGTLVANVANRQVGTLVAGAASVARISGRQFHLGLGAGSAPTTKWAFEQRAVGNVIADSLEARHARVREVLDLTDRAWSSNTPVELSTMPIPFHTPTRIIGVNSVALSQLAGARADGINVAWGHPRRDELLAAADAVVGGRPFIRTTWIHYDEALLDAEHPVRAEMERARIDRVILSDLGRPRLAHRASR
jgi:alkanesulfonate monooxygenase SsuD/methylene tetrahydromethanopterin reductase-like flavin-dependent oxidoreductase (luciferase family)